jgi:hypothetical protein
MKPLLEKVRPPEGASWAWLDRRLDDGIPFQWHHHPEYELTLTLNSRGQRFVGDAIGDYGDADLVLVGPNLPNRDLYDALREAMPVSLIGDALSPRDLQAAIADGRRAALDLPLPEYNRELRNA